MKTSLRKIVAVVTLLTLCACGTTRRAQVVDRTDARTKRTEASAAEKKLPKTKVDGAGARALLAEAETWLGTPYLYGGNDRNGIDCSGFVLQVYLNALQIKLPRTSATQAEYCKGIHKQDLSPGDLVFFDTSASRNGRVSHVGMYIGDGRMIHASSSKGVIVSSLDAAYYSQRLLTCGHVSALDKASKAAAPPKEEQPAKKQKSVKPKQPKEHKPKAKPEQAPIVIPSVQEVPVTVAAKPAAGDARQQVLNALIEQKLDSIYSKK